MGIVIDFSNMKPSLYDVKPPGRYIVSVHSVTEDTHTNDQGDTKDRVRWTFQIEEVVGLRAGFDGEPDDLIGTYLSQDTFLTENALWKVHEFLTALGEDLPKGEFEIDPEDLVGRWAIADVTIRKLPRTGMEVNNVKLRKHPDGSGTSTLFS